MIHLVGGLDHFYFSIYIFGIIIPIDFHIFQRCGSTTNQSRISSRIFRICHCHFKSDLSFPSRTFKSHQQVHPCSHRHFPSTTHQIDGWNPTHFKMVMIGGWCKWHCYTNITSTLVGFDQRQELLKVLLGFIRRFSGRWDLVDLQRSSTRVEFRWVVFMGFDLG